MKKIMLISLLGVSSIIFLGCSQNNKNTALEESELEKTTSTSQQIDHSPSETIDTTLNHNWLGKYEGVFPCADCEGIKIELELKPNNTYELSEEYLGSNPQTESETKGSFSFDAVDKSLITLDEKADHRKFTIGEGFIEARDIQTGKKIESSLNYKLLKSLD